MNCGEFEQRLNDALDERQNPSADFALEAHAAECAACRTLAAAYRAFTRRSAMPQSDYSPEEVANGVLALLRSRRRRRAAWSTAIAGALAAAAAVLMAVSLPPRLQSGSPSPVAAANAPDDSRNRDFAASPQMADASNSAAVAEATRDSFAAALDALPLTVFEPSTQGGPDEDWTATLAPVAHSAGESLAALFAWPGSRFAQTEPQ